MGLNKRALAISIIKNVKETNDKIVPYHLDKFALVENKNKSTIMICYTVKEHKGKYFIVIQGNNKRALVISILKNVKETNDKIVAYHLDKFALVQNKNKSTIMICFTVKEHETKYFIIIQGNNN